MAEKTLEYYMSLPYRVEIFPEEDGSGYTATIPDLPGCMTCAETLDELWEMIEEAKELWLEVALDDGDYIPEPPPIEVEEYSGQFIVRIPRSLHGQLARRAKSEKTSLNQLVLALLSEGMGRWSERKAIRPEQFTRVSKPFQPHKFQELATIVEKQFFVHRSPEFWSISWVVPPSIEIHTPKRKLIKT